MIIYKRVQESFVLICTDLVTGLIHQENTTATPNFN